MDVAVWFRALATRQFRNLLFRRSEPRFYAFDLLSFNNEDLRYFPLSDRKHRLRGIVPHEAGALAILRSHRGAGSIYSGLHVNGSSIHTS